MRKDRVTLICSWCNTPFDVQRHRAELARFCSHACYGKWRHGKVFQDIKNPNYVVDAYRSGKTATDIAAEIGMTTAGVCYRLKKAGVKIRPNGANLRSPQTIEAMKYRPPGWHPHNFRELPIDEIVSRYNAGESAGTIAASIGVTDAPIYRRLKAAGVKIRRAGFSRRRKCPDGHVVDSQWEYAVDRWLSERDIPHEVHPVVPWYVSGKSPERADFLVGNTYIEIWGIIGNEKYNAKRLSKTANYAKCGTPLIEVFPHHILSGDFSPLAPLISVNHYSVA